MAHNMYIGTTVLVLQHVHQGYATGKIQSRPTVRQSVFCPGLKKAMVLFEEKMNFFSRNYILRALSRA